MDVLIEIRENVCKTTAQKFADCAYFRLLTHARQEKTYTIAGKLLT